MPLDVSFIKSYISVGLEQQNSVTFDDVQTMVFSFARIHSRLVEEPQVDELPDLNLLDPFRNRKVLKLTKCLFKSILFGNSTKMRCQHFPKLLWLFFPYRILMQAKK